MSNAATLNASTRPAVTPALVWAVARAPLLLVALFLLRHPILDLIERTFDIVWITLFVMDVSTTPLTRALLALGAGLAFFIVAKTGERLSGWKGYAIAVAFVAIATFAVTTFTGGPRKLILLLIIALAAFNWAPMSLLARAGLTDKRLNLLIAMPPLVSEGLFASRYFSWLKQTVKGMTPAHAEQPAKWLGAAIAALALAVIVPGQKLVATESAMRAGDDVRMISQSDFNGLAYDAATKTLFATGHGVERALAYDTTNFDAPPRELDTDTGYTQGIEYSAANAELYLYNPGANIIQIFDSNTLAQKRTIPAPVSPGDSWLVYEPISDTLTLSSEADDRHGTPFLTINRTSGEVIDQRTEEAGNIMAHPTAPIVYLTFFRRFIGVMAYDPRTKEIVAKAPTDARMDRMAFDKTHDELLIASPAEGRIQRFDAKTLAPKGAFDSIFGVRVLAIDEAHDEMMVGSLATGKVALMGLSDRKIKRTWFVGPWLRSIVLAPERGVAFISSNGGLYELRYAHRD
jgi:hypothetical protein